MINEAIRVLLVDDHKLVRTGNPLCNHKWAAAQPAWLSSPAKAMRDFRGLPVLRIMSAQP